MTLDPKTLGLLNQSEDLIAVFSTYGSLVTANESFERQLGPSRKFAELFPDNSELIASVLDAHEKGKQVRLDLEVRTTQKDPLILVALLFVAEDSDRQIVMAARDVTSDRAYVRQLEHKATTDELTGALNRTQLLIMLSQAIRLSNRSKSTGCFLFLDLNGFKNINDSLGHDAGDKLLIETVRVLKANLRESDVVAMVGGDEFAIILNSTDSELGSKKTAQLAEAISSISAGDQYGVTVSIGLIEFPSSDRSPEEIVTAADHAMYRAKRESRSVVVGDQ